MSASETSARAVVDKALRDAEHMLLGFVMWAMVLGVVNLALLIAVLVLVIL